MTKNVKNIVGITSLIMAATAIVLPYLLFLQRPSTTTIQFPSTLLGIYDNRFFYTLAGIGFVIGIVGLRSKYGKAGFIITTIALSFVLCCWAFTLVYP